MPSNAVIAVVKVLLAFATIASFTGCSISLGGGSDSRPRQEVPKSPPVVVLPGNSEDSATLAEIDAAGNLGFDGNRTGALKNVAARSGITPAAQVHLVNVALRQLSFDGNKVEVLLTLINNPAFCAAAKEAILRQLSLLSFEGSRTQVLGAIQARQSNG
ncbi:MAG: hypothetical protein IT581_20380 [Verrucomicrobiales bacterium]|nr:hypothetical protein [Verrucomicrobiales bacterium]